MGRRIVATAVGVGTVVGALLLATSAYAATPVPNIVSAAAVTTTGSVPFTASPTGTITLTFSNGSNFVCAPSSTSLAGAANRGANSSGLAATFPASGVRFGSATYAGAVAGGGTITPGSAPCTTWGGTVPLAVKACSTWALQTIGASNASPHPPSAPVAGQTTPIQIAGICADMYLGTSNSCHWRVSGLVTGSYQNTAASPTFTIDPNKATTLTISDTSNPTTGCVGGAFSNGGTLRITATFTVKAPTAGQNPVFVNA